MSYQVYSGEFSTPVLRIEVENSVIEFSVEGMSVSHREWLAKLLEKQIKEAIQRNVELAIEGQQKALRALAGLS